MGAGIAACGSGSPSTSDGRAATARAKVTLIPKTLPAPQAQATLRMLLTQDAATAVASATNLAG
jgi:hypothetical protein